MLKTYLREKRRKKIEREKNDDHVLQKRIIFFLEIKDAFLSVHFQHCEEYQISRLHNN